MLKVHAPKQDVAFPLLVHLPLAAPPCCAGFESWLRPKEEPCVLSNKGRFRKETGRSRPESGFKTLVLRLGRFPCFVLVDTAVNNTLSTAPPPPSQPRDGAVLWTFPYLLCTLILCKCQQCVLLPTSVICGHTGEGIQTAKGGKCAFLFEVLQPAVMNVSV